MSSSNNTPATDTNEEIISSSSFIKPVRRILTDHDLEIFSTSETKTKILDFISSLNDSVKGKTNDEPVSITKVCP